MTQPDLYPETLYGGKPPHQAADTSRDAAEEIRHVANRIRSAIYALVVGAGGLTIDEIAIIRETTPNAVSPRIRELFLLGRITDSGRRRRTRTGRKAIIWKANNPTRGGK